jgi:hypothetical protein
VGHSRYGEGKVIARLSAEVQKPQKRPERGDQLLRRRCTALAGARQKKVSHSLSVPSADVLTERLEQVHSTANVLPESRLLHPAMRSKPVAEGGHKGWIGRHILDWFRRADPTTAELPMEKLRSKR